MKRIPILAIIASSLLAVPAPAADGTAKVPLFGRTLAFTLPTGFKIATDKNNGTNVLIEYLPAGETFANWTKLITVQAYRGLGKDPRSTAAIARSAFYPAACKVGPIYSDGGELTVSPGIKRTIVVNGCASLPAGAYPQALKGAGEEDFIVVYRDAETIYTLNYAVRGAPFSGKSPPHPVADAEQVLTQALGRFTLQ